MPVDTGNTAWMLMSTALVMLMLPGLALFYGGLVRAKNVLSTIMHSFFGLAIVTVVWVILGFSLAFAPSLGGLGIVGGFDYAFFNGAFVSSIHSRTLSRRGSFCQTLKFCRAGHASRKPVAPPGQRMPYCGLPRYFWIS